MSIPRKGSRRVEVDGAEFRWVIRKDPTYAQGALRAPMVVAIQLEEGRSVCRVHLGVSRPDNWVAPHQTQVTPMLVRRMIREALGKGWVPSGDQGFELAFPLIQDR